MKLLEMVAPCKFMHTPGATFNSVWSSRTLAHFSIVPGTTMAGGHPPISIKASA
jgi:hypothetical protein